MPCDENYSSVECSVKRFITGYVFEDKNNNSMMEGDEYGIENITVFLQYENENKVNNLVTKTDANGMYKFIVDVPCDSNANFNLSVNEIYGFENTTPREVSGTLSEADAEVNFGFKKLTREGKIYGKIYYDKNISGNYDANESGISRVKVSLFDGESIVTTLTNITGDYEFIVDIPYDGANFSVSVENVYGMHNTSPNNVVVEFSSNEFTKEMNFGFDKDAIAVKFDKYINNSNPKYNDVVEFAIYIENIGKENIYNVTVADMLPDGFVNLSSVTFNIPEISSDASVTLFIKALVNTSNHTSVENIAVTEFKDKYGNNYSGYDSIKICMNH